MKRQCFSAQQLDEVEAEVARLGDPRWILGTLEHSPQSTVVTKTAPPLNQRNWELNLILHCRDMR